MRCAVGGAGAGKYSVAGALPQLPSRRGQWRAATRRGKEYPRAVHAGWRVETRVARRGRAAE